MRMMLGLAASLAAKLNLSRSLLATANLVDQVVSGVRPELWSRSYHRLRRVSYLLRVLKLELEL